MKQNMKKNKNSSGGGQQDMHFASLFGEISKRQIKKKQRRFFKEEKGESLLSKLSKSSSLMIKKSKRKKPLRWSENETATFYKCLEFFGKDFEMITSVFHNKRKRQIMRKFHKERKRHPERLNQSLKKHESNVIRKNYKEDTFFENFFDKTDTSEDEMSFHKEPNLLMKKVGMEKKKKDHSIILEGLIEEEQEFEREIDFANHQNGMSKMSRKNSLNDLLFKINTDNRRTKEKEKIFNFQEFHSSKLEVKEEFFPRIMSSTTISKDQNDFWVSNRIQEEVSEKPPPQFEKSFCGKMDNVFNMLPCSKIFEEFDNQLKQQSGIKIKPLNFYLEEELSETKK